MADFFSRAEAAQIAIAGNREAVSKRARWISRGRRYMRGSGRGVTGAWIQTDPAFHGRVLEMMAAAAPAVADSINKHLVPAAQRAFDQWPVKTGLSRSALALEFETLGEDKFVASLRSRAPYTWFIGNGATAKRLIFDAGTKAADAMAEDLADELAKVAG